MRLRGVAALLRAVPDVARLMARLVTDPVLPLDFSTHALVLLDELEALRTSLGERHSVNGLIAAAETLHEMHPLLAGVIGVAP